MLTARLLDAHLAAWVHTTGSNTFVIPASREALGEFCKPAVSRARETYNLGEVFSSRYGFVASRCLAASLNFTKGTATDIIAIRAEKGGGLRSRRRAGRRKQSLFGGDSNAKCKRARLVQSAIVNGKRGRSELN